MEFSQCHHFRNVEFISVLALYLVLFMKHFHILRFQIIFGFDIPILNEENFPFTRNGILNCLIFQTDIEELSES